MNGLHTFCLIAWIADEGRVLASLGEPRTCAVETGSKLLQSGRKLENAPPVELLERADGTVYLGSRDASLSPLISFSFVAETPSPMAFEAAGNSTSLEARGVNECSGKVGPEHAVGDLALVTMKYTNGACYAHADYSNDDYLVDQGKVSDFNGYRVHPAATRATSFLASGTGIYYRFHEKKDYKIYVLQDGQLTQTGVVHSANVIVGEFVDTGVTVHKLDVPSAYVFLADDVNVPEPAQRTLSGVEATECDMSDVEQSSFGLVALVTMRYKGEKCWTDGRYNSLNYLVQRGSLTGSDGSSLPAYRVHPPTSVATEFRGSQVKLFVKVPKTWEHKLEAWQYDGKDVKMRADIAPEVTKAGTFVNTGMTVDELEEPIVLTFVSDGSRVSAWPQVSSTVDGAQLAAGNGFSVSARRFQVGGNPFVPGTTSEGGHWGRGPGEHAGNYGTPKKFFPVARRGTEGVVWQDQEAMTVHATWFAGDLVSAETQTIYANNDFHLVAAAGDGQDAVALLMIAVAPPSDKSASAQVKAIKIQCSSGETLMTKLLDASKNGLNVHEFSSPGASMIWDTQTGKLGLVLARTMTIAGDGLNHQGAIAVVLDAATFDVVRNHGQTSGHSFGNSLLLASDGAFLSMDLGDNYPRGINLVRFDGGSKKGFVPYGFKTKHGTSPSNPAGRTYEEYSEISTPETTFYKWSNDNYVYTELGHVGVVEVDDGLLVFFSGEAPSLDNSVVGAVLNVARNTGVLKVKKDLSEIIAAGGSGTETGGYYGFNGNWHTQENTGVKWLSAFEGKDNSVSRLKTARVGTDSNLLYWEVWSETAYHYAQLAIVNDDGERQGSAWTFDYPVRLAIQDDLLVSGGRAIAYAGTPDGRLVRYEFCGGGGCATAAPAPGPPPAPTTPTPFTSSPATPTPAPTAPESTTPAPTLAPAPAPTAGHACTDSEPTSIKLNGQPASCTELAAWCSKDFVKADCPVTCDVDCCADSENTGFKLGGSDSDATCTQLAGWCNDANYGPKIRKVCPTTCGVC